MQTDKTDKGSQRESKGVKGSLTRGGGGGGVNGIDVPAEGVSALMRATTGPQLSFAKSPSSPDFPPFDMYMR